MGGKLLETWNITDFYLVSALAAGLTCSLN